MPPQTTDTRCGIYEKQYKYHHQTVIKQTVNIDMQLELSSEITEETTV